MPYSLKHAYALLLLILLSSCAKEADHSAYFSGEVINPRTRYVLFSKGNKVIDTLKLDKNNRFFIKFDSLTPGLYSFKHDPDYQYVYFDRNDSLMVTFNTADFDRSVSFSGRGDRKNNFMMELYMLNEIDRHQAYDVYSYDYKKFSHFTDSVFALRKNFYDKNKKDIQWSKNFDFYARWRLYLNYYSKKEYYPYVYARRTGEDVLPTLPKDYYSFRKKVNFNDARLIGFSPYMRYLNALLNNMAITRHFSQGNVAEEALRNNVDKLNIADSIFTNKDVKNEVLNTIAFNYLLEDQNISNNQKFLDRYMMLSTDKDKDNEIRRISKAIKKLKKGAKLPNTELVTTENKDFNVTSDIINETVIFFWTSCAPAHTERIDKKVTELKKQHPDVDFLAVNVDSDDEWKKTLGLYKFDGALQLHSANFDNLRDKWVITKINRTIILNADGTIKNAFTNLLDNDFGKSLGPDYRFQE